MRNETRDAGVRSLLVLAVFILASLVLIGCSSAPPVTGDAAKFLVVSALALIGVVVILLASGMPLPTPWGPVKLDEENRTWQVPLGVLGTVLVVASLVMIGYLIFATPSFEEPGDSEAVLGLEDQPADFAQVDIAELDEMAEQGDAGAQTELGERYEEGRGGVEEDYDAAVRWYRRAAGQEYARAQRRLGVMYANGYGVEQDEEEAVRLFRMAADQGNARAQYNLGVMYSGRRGVERDDEEAVRWFRRAANQDYVEAQFNLGVMYRSGRGLGRDEEEAARLFRAAAEQGDARAQVTLGIMYGTGGGVELDYEEAVRWFQEAADQDNGQRAV